jgi:NAD(P)-dependent dehydrogenase (short-subunit alcohol dehydrogenase family)
MLERPVEVIRGKKALVTGAASGIGRAIALALAREGADLFLVDIDESHLRISARDAEVFGSKVLVEVCDLSQPAQISACVIACLKSFSTLDILVNCAGIIYYGNADEMTAEKWNAVMSVNLLAPIQLVRELLPALTAQKESHILNVCSVLGLVPVPRSSADLIATNLGRALSLDPSSIAAVETVALAKAMTERCVAAIRDWKAFESTPLGPPGLIARADEVIE